MKRKVELVVVSDVHLGTFGCHAQELFNYLKSIKPDCLILNGDIIDMWQFKKSYFPKEHLLVINRILKLVTNGTKVYYITGNHDEMLRRFSGFSNGNFHLRDQLVLNINKKKIWFFHGDAFDGSILKARWLAKIGGKSYDWLIVLNRYINNILKFMGREPMSFAGAVKSKVKNAVKFINDFEHEAIDAAKNSGYDGVVCGHIHSPQIQQSGSVTYMNSGDWIENLTALEYDKGAWTMYKYKSEQYAYTENDLLSEEDEDEKKIAMNQNDLVSQFLKLHQQENFPTETITNKQ